MSYGRLWLRRELSRHFWIKRSRRRMKFVDPSTYHFPYIYPPNSSPSALLPLTEQYN
jgi:hypothetical protein